MTVPTVSKSVMSEASATVKPRTGIQVTVTGALVADSASQLTVAVRVTSAPLVVVRSPVQLVLAPGATAPDGVQVSVAPGKVTASGASAWLPVLVTVAVYMMTVPTVSKSLMFAESATVKAAERTRGTRSVSVADAGSPVQSPSTVAAWVKPPASSSAWVTVCGTVHERVAPGAIVVAGQVTPVSDDTGTSPGSETLTGTSTTVPAVTGPIAVVSIARPSSGVASTGLVPMKPRPSSSPVPAASSSPTMTTMLEASTPVNPTHRVELLPQPATAFEQVDWSTVGATWNSSSTVPVLPSSRTIAGTPWPSARVSRSPNHAPNPHTGRLNEKVTASRVVPSPAPPDSV